MSPAVNFNNGQVVKDPSRAWKKARFALSSVVDDDGLNLLPVPGSAGG